MKVKEIGFKKTQPETLTVKMSVQEAAYIARMIGRQNSEMSNAIMENGEVLSSEIYLCLTGEFFNKFWHGGVDDVK